MLFWREKEMKRNKNEYVEDMHKVLMLWCYHFLVWSLE